MHKNIWKQTKFMCAYRHKPSEMTIHEGINGSSPFYSCPHYYAENRADDENRACPMRLNFYDADKILDEFSKIINKDLSEDVVMDYTGKTFKYKQIDVTVSKYKENEELEFTILNKKALK